MAAEMAHTHLYKYGRLGDHSEQVFVTPTVWFSKPRELNDPFECRPWLTFNGTPAQEHESMARVIRKNRPRLTEQQVQVEAAGWYLAGRHRSDEFKQHMRDSTISMLSEKIGLYCLSEHRDSILMWSHYGKDHTGYCLEFEATAETPFFREAQQATYSDNYPIVDFYTTPPDVQAELIFLRKFSGWNYESEWRIIDFQRGHGAHLYPRELLTGVILGARMLPADKAKIRGWLNGRGHAVQLYEAKQDDRKFALDIRPVA